MAGPLEAEYFDTVIVGNGPAALILSYILHGHIPCYTGGHHDHFLDSKLRQSPDLTQLSPTLYNNVPSSSSYSSQALPINAFVDGLIRPNGDTVLDSSSCVEWRYEPEKAVSHVVLGSAAQPGGQWGHNPVKASSSIGALSYAEQLNLPGYSFADYWLSSLHESLPDMVRPTRDEVAGYLKSYPEAVRISDGIRISTTVSEIKVKAGGFSLQPFGIHCRRIVLATGIFDINLPAPRFLAPLATLPSEEEGPLLVIGSGFTAADIIISTPPSRKIIHIFNWDPAGHPSPLRACHGSAYPEYAWIYRQMKLVADGAKPRNIRGPPSAATAYVTQRNWAETYEGFPNSRIISLQMTENPFKTPSATVQIGRYSEGLATTRLISSFEYATGRRGSLSYLEPSLLTSVLRPSPSQSHAAHGLSSSIHQRSVTAKSSTNGTKPVTRDPHDIPSPPSPKKLDFAADKEGFPSDMVSRQTLRGKIEQQADAELAAATAGKASTSYNRAVVGAAGLEVAPDVFVIGSLTGDTLIRFAYGGCAAVAGAVMHRAQAAQLDRRKDVAVRG